MNKSTYKHPAIKVVDLHIRRAILEDNVPINNEDKRNLSDAESRGFRRNRFFWGETIFDK